ncbi:MAG: monooxygenase component MmoB/DmpM [Conexibacter sp.]|jgi:toluene monooxygenase system protein D|nr:monooxygenase component MmoB/DmpM [Conexibacter sp.]
MTETLRKKLVGPVLNDREMYEAVIDAADIDNPGIELHLEDREGYFRVHAEGRLRLTGKTIEATLGRPFMLSEFEQTLASFSGRINMLGDDEIVFYLENE